MAIIKPILDTATLPLDWAAATIKKTGELTGRTLSAGLDMAANVTHEGLNAAGRVGRAAISTGAELGVGVVGAAAGATKTAAMGVLQSQPVQKVSEATGNLAGELGRRTGNILTEPVAGVWEAAKGVTVNPVFNTLEWGVYSAGKAAGRMGEAKKSVVTGFQEMRSFAPLQSVKSVGFAAFLALSTPAVAAMDFARVPGQAVTEVGVAALRATYGLVGEQLYEKRPELKAMGPMKGISSNRAGQS